MRASEGTSKLNFSFSPSLSSGFTIAEKAQTVSTAITYLTHQRFSLECGDLSPLWSAVTCRSRRLKRGVKPPRAKAPPSRRTPKKDSDASSMLLPFQRFLKETYFADRKPLETVHASKPYAIPMLKHGVNQKLYSVTQMVLVPDLENDQRPEFKRQRIIAFQKSIDER